MTKSNTQKSRMINFLASGKEFSATELSRRLSIANPSAVVSQLRDEGHVIWTNRRTDSRSGKTVYVYRYDAARTQSANAKR